jgi:hypothetical protein
VGYTAVTERQLGGKMWITKTSGLTGITRELDIDVTPEQIEAWKSGKMIQEAMPHLSADDREFLITGITPEEWEENFPDENGNFYHAPEFSPHME